MRPLYEIENDILECCIDTETGEIVDEEKLNELEMERDKKIEGVILWRKDLMAEAEAVRTEAQRLSARAKTCENKAEQLKNWAKFALRGEKFKTERCSVSYRTTKSIVIDNPAELSFDFLKEPKEDWFSKTAIKEAIEKGATIKGAHQEDKNGIVIK